MSAEAPVRRALRPRRTSGDQLREALLLLCGHRGQIVEHRERPWASITFAGARHTVALLFIGEDAVLAGEEFLAALPDHEFAIAGQLVADASATAVEHRMLPTPRLAVTCELLLLEDA